MLEYDRAGVGAVHRPLRFPCQPAPAPVTPGGTIRSAPVVRITVTTKEFTVLFTCAVIVGTGWAVGRARIRP